MNNPPTSRLAYEDIRGQLRRRIGRQWKAGDRLPSVRELARELGAGHVNTHRAVRSLADEGVLIARHRVGVFVADDARPTSPAETPAAPGPSHMARPLAGLRVHAMVGHEESKHIMARLADAFEQRMAQHHCDVTRHLINQDVNQWRDLSDHDCDAIAILSGLVASRLTVRDDVPLVVAANGVTSTTYVEPVTDCDLVGVDNHHGGILAGRYLRDAGFDDVVIIGRQYKHPITHVKSDPPHYDDLSAIRIAGFERGFGREIEPQRKLYASFYGPGPGARLVPQYMTMRPRPVGVFATTDDLAIGFIHGAQSHGLEPGRDYHIIGFDGQQLGRDMQEGPLTTVDLLMEEMGLRAADLLAERMLNPNLPRRQFAIGCRVFEGATVRPDDSPRRHGGTEKRG